eukprot:22485-Chlamydomonas_euryale.AAC.3
MQLAFPTFRGTAVGRPKSGSPPRPPSLSPRHPRTPTPAWLSERQREPHHEAVVTRNLLLQERAAPLRQQRQHLAEVTVGPDDGRHDGRLQDLAHLQRRPARRGFKGSMEGLPSVVEMEGFKGGCPGGGRDGGVQGGSRQWQRCRLGRGWFEG